MADNLQKSVGLQPAIGIAGQQVAPGSAWYTAQNYMSDGTAACGAFAFAKENTSATGAVVFGLASATGAAGAKPLGLVERTFTGVKELSSTTASDVYLAGENLTIAERSNGHYIVATAAATVGQAVLCDPTTGAITFGAAGAANDTGWVVASAGSAGDTIIIKSIGVSVATANP